MDSNITAAQEAAIARVLGDIFDAFDARIGEIGVEAFTARLVAYVAEAVAA